MNKRQKKDLIEGVAIIVLVAFLIGLASFAITLGIGLASFAITLGTGLAIQFLEM